MMNITDYNSTQQEKINTLEFWLQKAMLDLKLVELIYDNEIQTNKLHN